MQEQFQRFASLLNDDQINKITSAKVCIVGLGGVGSVSALAFARLGFNNFILCDHDVVSVTNINRQLVANLNTIGRKKVDVCEEMIKEINPLANIVKLDQKYSSESILFDYQFDYLVDAIDDLNNKFHLIKTCLEKNITFISSMGTAKKFDLTRLSVMEINKTSYDPLAKKLRKRLREEGIKGKVYVVSSTEEVNDCDILGSYMPVTATAGMLLTDYIVQKIISNK